MLIKFILMLYVTVMCLFISVPSYSAENPDFTPKWRVGDSWEIVTRENLGWIPGFGSGKTIESAGGPLYIHFRVIDLKEINNEMCYVVEVTERALIDREALQLNVRKDDFTLKSVIEITRLGDGTIGKREYLNDNTRDFTIFTDSFYIPILCDFPNLPAANTDEERTIRVYGSDQTTTQKVTFVDDNTVEIELSTKVGEGFYKTTQIWEKGKAWWSSVNRTFTYYDYSAGKEKTRLEYNAILEGTDLGKPQLNLTVTPDILWPPNHEMVEITPTTTVIDDYDRFPEVKLYSVESNEPDDASGAGNGNTTQDIQTTQVWDTKQHKMLDKILLRAEREGKGSGRIYTITYSATDFSGNTSTATATVTVPHDLGEE